MTITRKKLIEVALSLEANNAFSAREPDFGVTNVNYDFADLLARTGKPS
jgi:hypothetical protein